MPLIVVPTPIGNLGDITERAAEALRGADVVACEDTRRALKLMNRLGIKKPLVSYHRHSERSRTPELADRVADGATVALISDAGTPGISDPGHELIGEVISRGLPIDVLPGPVAFVPALLLSGLDSRRFAFIGFLEEKQSARRRALDDARALTCTLIFYSAPHDLARDTADILEALGDRRAAIVREISKIHQETIRGSLAELERTAAEREIKGEIVIVVEGASAEAQEPDDWREQAAEMRRCGTSVREIAAALHERGVAKNDVKRYLTDLERDR